jgi:hypothetical protein
MKDERIVQQKYSIIKPKAKPIYGPKGEILVPKKSYGFGKPV